MHLSLGKAVPGRAGLAGQEQGGFLPLAALQLQERKGFGSGTAGP